MTHIIQTIHSDVHQLHMLTAAEGSFHARTFCIFGLLVLEALVQLPCMTVGLFYRLMEDAVLSCYSCVDTLHSGIKLVICHLSFHVPV